MVGVALLHAARPHNGLACALLALAGYWRGGGRDLELGGAIATAVVLLCSAAHLVNDLVDLGADRTNRPSRPLPAGTLMPSLARKAAFVFWAGGLALGLALVPGWWPWWLFWALCGPGYSLLAKGRGWIAPCWTAVVIGSCYLAGVLDAGVRIADVLIFIAISYFIFFRELIKITEDTAGDIDAGYRSLAAEHSQRWAGLLGLSLPLLAVGMLAVWGVWAGRLGQLAGGAFLIVLAGALGAIRSRSLRDRHLPGSLLKIGCFCGLTVLWGIIS